MDKFVEISEYQFRSHEDVKNVLKRIDELRASLERQLKAYDPNRCCFPTLFPDKERSLILEQIIRLNRRSEHIIMVSAETNFFEKDKERELWKKEVDIKQRGQQ